MSLIGNVRSEPVRWTKVPQELTRLSQWVAWKSSERNGKQQKIPINPSNGKNASVRDPRTWGSFEEAREWCTSSELDGVGFVLTEADPFVVIDIDDCRDPESKQLTKKAKRIKEIQDSYA